MAQIEQLDPRPKVRPQGDVAVVAGWRCVSCNYPITQPVLRCPECSGEMVQAEFGPEGTVRASTTIRVRVPGQVSPYSIAYIDLDNGPRVLAHTPGDAPIPLRARAVITGHTDSGSLAARLTEED